MHTGEKPFECGICKKVFISGSNLKQHEITHRPEKARDKFACKFCNKILLYAASIRKHAQLYHPKELKMVGNKPRLLCDIIKADDEISKKEDNVISDSNNMEIESSMIEIKQDSKIQRPKNDIEEQHLNLGDTFKINDLETIFKDFAPVKIETEITEETKEMKMDKICLNSAGSNSASVANDSGMDCIYGEKIDKTQNPTPSLIPENSANIGMDSYDSESIQYSNMDYLQSQLYNIREEPYYMEDDHERYMQCRSSLLEANWLHDNDYGWFD